MLVVQASGSLSSLVVQTIDGRIGQFLEGLLHRWAALVLSFLALVAATM